jgi:hypothetical protein
MEGNPVMVTVTGCRLDDAHGALVYLIEQTLAAQTPAVEMRLDGVGSQSDGTGGSIGSYAQLSTDLRADRTTGPRPKLNGTGLLEVTLAPKDDDAYWHNEVGEALRGILEGVNVPVYGHTSGTPATLQGVLNVTNFSWQIVADTDAELILEAQFQIQER